MPSLMCNRNPSQDWVDLFILGDHRVVCGDCTQPDVVARVLGDAKPLLLVTDPLTASSSIPNGATWLASTDAAPLSHHM
jgi:hypothetical protein